MRCWIAVITITSVTVVTIFGLITFFGLTIDKLQAKIRAQEELTTHQSEYIKLLHGELTSYAMNRACDDSPLDPPPFRNISTQPH